jgi:hypothetical protein
MGIGANIIVSSYIKEEYGNRDIVPIHNLRYPMNGWLGGSQIRSEHFGEKKIFLPLGGRKPLFFRSEAGSLSLYRLSYPDRSSLKIQENKR